VFRTTCPEATHLDQLAVLFDEGVKLQPTGTLRSDLYGLSLCVT